MSRRGALAVLLAALAAGCSRRETLNYKHCLKLRVGMTRDDMLRIMGPPEETMPFVEGKTLDYLKGRTAYEWSNPATMPSPDHVSVDDASGAIESVRCGSADLTAPVFVDPSASTTTAVAPSTGAAAAVTGPSPAGR